MGKRKPPSKTPRRTVYRSAITGEFVTKQQAKRNPNTTEKEHYRPNPSDPQKK